MIKDGEGCGPQKEEETGSMLDGRGGSRNIPGEQSGSPKGGGGIRGTKEEKEQGKNLQRVRIKSAGNKLYPVMRDRNII